MGVAVAIINDGFLLHGFLRRVQGDDDLACGIGLRGEDGKFERIEAAAGISIRHGSEVETSVRLDAGVHAAEAALHIAQSALHERFEVRDAQRLQREDLGAADQRAVHIEEGIMRGRADEAQRTALQMRQQYVLLRFVEAVDLIHKEDGRLVVEPQVMPGVFRFLADVCHAAFHAAERDEA